MAKFKVNESAYIKHQGANPWRIVQIDNPERGDDALYHLRDSRLQHGHKTGLMTTDHGCLVLEVDAIDDGMFRAIVKPGNSPT